MTLPRVSAPPKGAREVLPERLVRRDWMSLSCMLIRWETRERCASCVAPWRHNRQVHVGEALSLAPSTLKNGSSRYDEVTVRGCSSPYLCVSQDDTVPGIR